MIRSRKIAVPLLCLVMASVAIGCAQTRWRTADEIAQRTHPSDTAVSWNTRVPGSASPANRNALASGSVAQKSDSRKSGSLNLDEPTGSDGEFEPSERSEPDASAFRLIRQVSAEDDEDPQDEPKIEPLERSADRPVDKNSLQLDEVLSSVIASYPLLRSAMFGRNIAQGELLQANGEFDLKLKADTLNMPLGFYENYRHAIGAEQPLFGGGSVFGGYRIGRGNFPEWYGERETKQGGEFKAGATIPLAQGRDIDDRRAGLYRSSWEVQSVEPEIQAQLIAFIQGAAISYWNWVAAGQNVRVNAELLEIATDRTDGLQKRVDRGDAPAIELTDNERLIVSRRTKLIDAQRKFQQAAYKLSLFLRDESGNPRVIDESRLPPRFPDEDDPSLRNLDADIQSAIANRPELRALAILREQLHIDLANAQNMLLPQVDAVLVGSQDVGAPAKKKLDDKGPFELEGGFVASVPLQRRKAQGKSQAVEGKLAQLQAKSQFTQEKIVAEVQSASVALIAAYQQLAQARQALALARQMEAAERRKFDLGDSNLLLVNLREQATADAALTEVEAQFNYFAAEADYRAALGSDAVPSN